VCKALLGLALLAAAPLALGQQLGDPTQPTALDAPNAAATAQQAGPRWRLQSTLVADNRRLAVINGRTVAAGDRIDGATVREVRQEGVTLDVDGRKVELRILGKIDVKRAGG
jgi:MSHA biogenesis protein MshK